MNFTKEADALQAAWDAWLDAGTNDTEHEAALLMAEAIDQTLKVLPRWTISEVIEDAGDVGGDAQVGPSSQRRFTFGPVAARWMVIDEHYYPTELPDDEHGSAFGWEDMTMLTICEDLEDPGGTELDSDVLYGEGGYALYGDLERATAAAKGAAGQADLTKYGYYDPTEELMAGHIVNKGH